MEEIKKIFNINDNNLRYHEFNKIEWINYFNNELKIESINNQLDDKNNNSNKTKKNFKNKLTKKNNICIKNKSKKDVIIIFSEEEKSESSNNKNLKQNKNKKILRNKYKKNIKLLNKFENANCYSKSIEAKEINNKSSQNKNNIAYLQNARYQSKDKLENNNKNNLRLNKYSELSYAKRYKNKKDLNVKYYLFPHEDKLTIGNNFLIERTLPEMKVLNNYGLVNDKDYEFHKKLINIKYKECKYF